MKPRITNIVFTKNRPLQLEAYLRSLRRSIAPELLKTYVLQKVELFQDQYQQVFQQYPDCTVVQETNFHKDMLAILQAVDTPYVLFGIDDVVYFDSVDFGLIEEPFQSQTDDIFGFSFRFGEESVRQGGDTVEKADLNAGTVFRFNWQKGRTPSTRYPFELTSTIYRTSLVREIIAGTMSSNPLAKALFTPGSPIVRTLGAVMSQKSILKRFGFFFSPNNFESWPCRWCQNHPEILPPFTYFQKLCASAIQVNMVNTTTRQKVAAAEDFSVEALNAKFKQGYRVDIDFVAASRPTIRGCGREFFKLTKL